METSEEQRLFRLQEMIEKLKKNRQVLTQAEFGETVGLKPAQISDILNGKRPLTEKTLTKILSSFPNINPDWLLYGKGEMIRIVVKTGNILTSGHHNTVTGINEINGIKHQTGPSTDKALESLDKVIGEMAAQRKVTQKCQEQMDRLLTMLETGKKGNATT